jgi:hypothetical protein
LHFDGKRIEGQEFQVVVLKNELREVKLEVLDLPNSKAETVFKGITTVLDEYNLWNSIKMIVTDYLYHIQLTVLLPHTRNSLLQICRFISYRWADHWFTDQMYDADDYQNLCRFLQDDAKALNCVKKFWNPEPSRLKIPRTNQTAERAIKCLQDLYEVCKKKAKLKLRFILLNKT